MYRETIPETRFVLGALDWSVWNLAMAEKAPTDDPDEGWAPRPGKDHVGMRKPVLFPNTMCEAMYEFAVQPQDGARKYPVYYRTTEGFDRASWDTYLLRNKRVKGQVDQVIKKGCKLFVRRAKLDKSAKPLVLDEKPVNSVADLKGLIQETYDYAWDMSIRSKRRDVIKRGKLISGPSFKSDLSMTDV